MIQKEKQLLLRDLCGRLPYGVKMRYKDNSGYEVLCQIDTFYKDVDGFHCLLRTTGPYGGFQDLNELKPYLRQMSSMTEEEVLEFIGLNVDESHRVSLPGHKSITWWDCSGVQDWLNAHHFDYRGLIERGLAIEAPEGMYKTE